MWVQQLCTGKEPRDFATNRTWLCCCWTAINKHCSAAAFDAASCSATADGRQTLLLRVRLHSRRMLPGCMHLSHTVQQSCTVTNTTSWQLLAQTTSHAVPGIPIQHQAAPTCTGQCSACRLGQQEHVKVTTKHTRKERLCVLDQHPDCSALAVWQNFPAA
jgi:hypothetical protein